jgi:hypothetical protein
VTRGLTLADSSGVIPNDLGELVAARSEALARQRLQRDERRRKIDALVAIDLRIGTSLLVSPNPQQNDRATARRWDQEGREAVPPVRRRHHEQVVPGLVAPGRAEP